MAPAGAIPIPPEFRDANQEDTDVEGGVPDAASEPEDVVPVPPEFANSG